VPISESQRQRTKTQIFNLKTHLQLMYFLKSSKCRHGRRQLGAGGPCPPPPPSFSFHSHFFFAYFKKVGGGGGAEPPPGNFSADALECRANSELHFASFLLTYQQQLPATRAKNKTLN